MRGEFKLFFKIRRSFLWKSVENPTLKPCIFRMTLIEDAFGVMDVADNGVVNLNDLKKCYSVKGKSLYDPLIALNYLNLTKFFKGNLDFENGRKTEDEILNTFLETFEANAHIDGQGKFNC